MTSLLFGTLWFGTFLLVSVNVNWIAFVLIHQCALSQIKINLPSLLFLLLKPNNFHTFVSVLEFCTILFYVPFMERERKRNRRIFWMPRVVLVELYVDNSCSTHHQPIAVAQAIAISNSCLSKPHAPTSAIVYPSHVRSFACAPQRLTEQYTIESLCIYSREYLPLHIVTFMWILALTKLLYKVPFTSDGTAKNYFISSSSIGIVHTQGTKLNLEVTQGDYKTLMTC